MRGARAVGLTGKDGGLLRAKKMKVKSGGGEVDVGQVGEVESVDAAVLSLLDAANFIPVVAPIGADGDGGALNVNADWAAAHIAAALGGGSAFYFLTNTAGVLDKKDALVPELTAARAKSLMKSGAIAGGMKPKTECALFAVSHGVASCRIINGTTRHALLLGNIY